MGLLFQIPVGDPRGHALGIVTPRQLQRNRALRDPRHRGRRRCCCPTPDPVTMLLMMVPLVVLFEGSIRWRAARPRALEPDAREEDADDADDDGDAPEATPT